MSKKDRGKEDKNKMRIPKEDDDFFEATITKVSRTFKGGDLPRCAFECDDETGASVLALQQDGRRPKVGDRVRFYGSKVGIPKDRIRGLVIDNVHYYWSRQEDLELPIPIPIFK